MLRMADSGWRTSCDVLVNAAARVAIAFSSIWRSTWRRCSSETPSEQQEDKQRGGVADRVEKRIAHSRLAGEVHLGQGRSGRHEKDQHRQGQRTALDQRVGGPCNADVVEIQQQAILGRNAVESGDHRERQERQADLNRKTLSPSPP